MKWYSTFFWTSHRLVYPVSRTLAWIIAKNLEMGEKCRHFWAWLFGQTSLETFAEKFTGNSPKIRQGLGGPRIGKIRGSRPGLELPPTKPLLFVGPSQGQDWKLFKRDWIFQSLSCESWVAFLILEPWNPPAISCSFLPCPPPKLHFSAGRCIFLQENAPFCSLLWGVKNYEW